MARYQAGEIHFNLMAIVQDKLVRYKEQMLASVITFLNEQRNLNYSISHVSITGGSNATSGVDTLHH